MTVVAAFRRLPAALAFLAFAFVPLYPAISLVALTALLIGLAVRGHLDRADLDAPVAVLSVTVAVLGSLAQVANWAAPTVPQALAEPPVPIATGSGGNLLAAHDVSWLRAWTRDGGLGVFAAPVEGGFWRLPANDPTSGGRVREAVAALEVPIATGTGYALSVLLRHDGSWVEGALLERTREGRQRLATVTESIGPSLVRLSATIAPRDAAARLRSLHLVDLDGDWNRLDVGWPSLSQGTVTVTYAPRASEPPWPAGVAWWLGLGAVWALLPVAVRAIARLGAGDWISWGLLAGLVVQAFLAIGQVVTAGAGAPRATGSLMEPNLLAHAALLAALTATATARRTPWAGVPAMVLAVGIIIASGSRAAILGLTFGAATLAAVLGHPRGRRRTLTLAVGLLAVGVVAAAAVLSARLDEPWREDPNVRARLQVWQAGLQVVADRPLVGVGHERLALFYEFWQPTEAGPVYRNNHAHNAWLALATSFGLPTTAAFAGLLLTLLVQSPRRRPAFVVMAIALTVNLVDLSLFHPAFFMPLWTACSLPPPKEAVS